LIFCCSGDKWYNGINEEGNSFLKAEEIAHLAVEAASEKQAHDIIMLDVQEHCSFTSYFVLCNAESDRQLEAIWQGILESLKNKGCRPLHCEGTKDSGWMLADFGSVIVHVLVKAEWDYYRLDRLWDKAPAVVRLQ
jgi:ribosome-associated protein